MLEPDVAEEIFKQGDKVLLVRREGAVFFAINNVNQQLIDGE